MKYENTKIPDVIFIAPDRYKDNRGYFAETYSKAKYSEIGIDVEFVQDNHSLSAKKGTVRGLHFQAPPHAQAKLVRCGRGAIFDVAVDIRVGSPSYGRWVGYELSEENGAQLYVPVGFAHGFMSLQPDSEIIYKCSDIYAPECEGAVRWNDQGIGIGWPSVEAVHIKQGDATAPLFVDMQSPFNWEDKL